MYLICTYCLQEIKKGEKYVAFKIFKSTQYETYHNRDKTDCYSIVWHKEAAEAYHRPEWDKAWPKELPEGGGDAGTTA